MKESEQNNETSSDKTDLKKVNSVSTNSDKIKQSKKIVYIIIAISMTATLLMIVLLTLITKLGGVAEKADRLLTPIIAVILLASVMVTTLSGRRLWALRGMEAMSRNELPKVVCKECGAANDAGSEYCNNCGNKLN